MTNPNRRKFIKTALLCGGFFLVGRVMGSLFPNTAKFSGSENLLEKNKRESDRAVAYYDNNGNKVLIVEK